MPQLLSESELKKQLAFEYSKNTVLKNSRKNRDYNIRSFNNLSRENLKYGVRERRLCLYETLNGEKIYIQYPGKESEEKSPKMPLDFRPELQMSDGKLVSAASFGDIWDVLSVIGKEQNKILPFVAAIFLKIGYMHSYSEIKNNYEYSDIDIDNDKIIASGSLQFSWFSLNLSDDIWYTLNDRIGEIKISDNERFSFEAFIKFVDLLFQNEDCKYYYKNVILKKVENYNYSNGRTSSSEANLLIINHLEENTKLSVLLDAFQKSRGVPSFKKTDYSVVTNGIVVNIDMQ